MQRVVTLTVAFAVLAMAGCGGPSEVKVKGEGGKELTLDPPNHTSITQGATEKLKVEVKRKGFDEKVTIDFSQLPDGVSIVEEERSVAPGKTDATFTLKADAGAKPVEGHMAKVAASGGGMKAGPVEFKINVKPKS